MSPENFCYWLQGALELSQLGKFDYQQTQIIQDHLDLVFKKETPTREKPFVVDQGLVSLRDSFIQSPSFTFPPQVTC